MDFWTVFFVTNGLSVLEAKRTASLVVLTLECVFLILLQGVSTYKDGWQRHSGQQVQMMFGGRALLGDTRMQI